MTVLDQDIGDGSGVLGGDTSAARLGGMSAHEPVDPRVRLEISRWPADAPRGAVTAFCAEHSISRKTFYLLRRRGVLEGPAAVLVPKSRRPHHSPTRIGEDVKQQVLAVRAALEESGWDSGPISVFDKMTSMGLEPPSIASLGRIFREKGAARAEPKKKPRSAFRRFVYPAPNACWQLDATEYVLAGGRTCVIFQLEDDHTRVAVASHVAHAETSEGAVAVFRKGIAARGVPQRLLTDNGAALNPIRQGQLSQLVAYANSLGVETITGKPGKPTTQGKNERFHQTLFRWLDAQPIAKTIKELQKRVDHFDMLYNTQRPHQALRDRMTPQQAWDATPVAPAPDPTRFSKRTGSTTRVVQKHGDISLRGARFQLGYEYAGTEVTIIWDATKLTIFDAHGTQIIEHAWPAPGIRYVGNGRNRGTAPKRLPPSPMS